MKAAGTRRAAFLLDATLHDSPCRAKKITRHNGLERVLMGKGPSKQGSRPLSLTVPVALYEYLTWLARNSVLGTRETEVASHILTEAIREMIEQKEHDRPFPRDSSPADDQKPSSD